MTKTQVLARIADFVVGVIRDPITKDGSSSRIAGLACVASGIIYVFTAQSVNPAVVSALIGFGAVPFLVRSRGRDMPPMEMPDAAVLDTDEGR